MKKNNHYFSWMILIVMLALLFTGCGSGDLSGQSDSSGSDADRPGTGEEVAAPTVAAIDAPNTAAAEPDGRGIESAEDGAIDFEVLKVYNPDIFAWLYVPGTDIDLPILQSGIADDYYQSHTSDGKEGAAGALYTEMPNLMNMCDFNTIIHGKDEGEEACLYDLHLFEDPDFFKEHDTFYIYMPDNLLTYTVVAAYYDEGSDILRRYDYTTFAGCTQYLKQLYGTREMGKHIRDGWEDLTPQHFLVTLDGNTSADGQSQYIVVGALTGDAAGVIDRVILD